MGGRRWARSQAGQVASESRVGRGEGRERIADGSRAGSRSVRSVAGWIAGRVAGGLPRARVADWRREPRLTAPNPPRGRRKT
eukprot:4247483-Pyramimonas_sp.AAC.1